MQESLFTLDELREILIFASDGSILRAINYSDDVWDFAEARFMLARMKLNGGGSFSYRSMLYQHCFDTARKLTKSAARQVIKTLRETFPTYNFRL